MEFTSHNQNMEERDHPSYTTFLLSSLVGGSSALQPLTFSERLLRVKEINCPPKAGVVRSNRIGSANLFRSPDHFAVDRNIGPVACLLTGAELESGLAIP